MITKRWVRRISALAAGGVLLQVNACAGGNFSYDVAVLTATGLVTTSIMTFLNSLVNMAYPTTQ